MIHIESVKLSEHKDYDTMVTQGKIVGKDVIIKEEIKTILLYCMKDDDLKGVLLAAIEEVIRDDN